MPPSVLVCLGKPDFHYSVYAGMLSTEPIITLNDESAVDAPDRYRESCEECHSVYYITRSMTYGILQSLYDYASTKLL